MSEKKNELKKALFYDPENGYDRLSPEEEKEMFTYCEEYKDFLLFRKKTDPSSQSE